MDYSIKIGGEAGQGIDTIGGILGKLFTRAGHYVFTHQDFESRVRGGHNFYQMRLSDKPLSASRDVIDILVALDNTTISAHEKEISKDGMIIYDAAAIQETHSESQFLNVPFVDLALKHGGSKIMANIVATGSIIGMLGMEIELLLDMIKSTFRKKGDEAVEANINAARAGYGFAVKECLRCSFTPAPAGTKKMLIAGNDAIGLGAMASGCKFYAAYPMTPSTGIMNFIAGKASAYGIVVEQAEDEIAAINMVLGASFGGVRAMTGSSGGGFALMVEGLSLAAMTETPVVIALAQRPAPATGLPTRTEQADLLFALHSGHGEFPRILFAPGSPEQAIYLTNKAFNLVEKYQIPAFILTDQYLADSEWTYETIDFSRLTYRDYRVRNDALQQLASYKRHAFTDSGVSPLGIPGESTHLVVTDSDEHTEEGHLTEDPLIRTKMVEKRLFKKLPLITAEIAPPLLYGDLEPKIVLVGWGSTYGPLKEAIDHLGQTKKIALLHFSEIYPFPLRDRFDYIALLNKARQTICVENNALGQFASLMRAETGYEFDDRINRFDGRPFTLETLVGEINGTFR
ncbi:MAG: 2-oxoacid:acceptor oxidoreductase subunit alpha [Syntrophus sp. (in: bacteria)]|nr:2-oxoacid:acceptor oxidoreductase subunit alpha [Syntrophus sp. (in: bacteria)]